MNDSYVAHIIGGELHVYRCDPATVEIPSEACRNGFHAGTYGPYTADDHSEAVKIARRELEDGD